FNSVTPEGTSSTTYEGGAMRFPPFLTSSGGDINEGASLFSYYYKQFGLSSEGFPNPGSRFATTGIYYNEGRLGDFKQPREMAIWDKTDTEPPNSDLRNVYNKWQTFANRLIDRIGDEYVKATWEDYWKSFVDNYWQKTFRDVVLDQPHTPTDEDPTNFGGAGMSEEEANLFYLIGGGDGSWGAFFNLSFLYAYRTFVHGFGSDLVLLHGRYNADGTFNPGPQSTNTSFTDSWNVHYTGREPKYKGARSIDDCLLFLPIEKIETPSGTIYENKSLYDMMAVTDPDVEIRFYLNTPVISIDFSENQHLGDLKYIIIASDNRPNPPIPYPQEYTSVISTVPTWQYGTDIDVAFLKNTDNPMRVNSLYWPNDLQSYFSRAHWEPALKVFVRLSEPYWKKEGNRIPQVFTSDTFIHDAYAYQSSLAGENEDAVLLVSYTWWRDAVKLTSYDYESLRQRLPGSRLLVNKCVDELDRICMESSNINQSIKDYIVPQSDPGEAGYVIRWEANPFTKGAARLYDQREWMDTLLPLAYNQEYSFTSNIYFAGESYNVDAGWTEPAFRTAIDAVLRLADNQGATINVTDFDMARDYPEYDTTFRPTQPSSVAVSKPRKWPKDHSKSKKTRLRKK
ncbi:MAG: FAD-dependent oxidoreductase, partial [Flavobacteriaceae bacterium]|nr:FAD-dependent oxidoreductase [Flavobacteriaceae bacterium]